MLAVRLLFYRRLRDTVFCCTNVITKKKINDKKILILI